MTIVSGRFTSRTRSQSIQFACLRRENRGGAGSITDLRTSSSNEFNEWVGLEALIAEGETEHGDPTDSAPHLLE